LPQGSSGESRVLWGAASGLSLGERLHLLGRFQSAPWERVLPSLFLDGHILDVGCGPGLLAHLLRRAGFRGRYCGIDPDPRKTDRARRWIPADPRTSFGVAKVEDSPAGAFSQVAVIDVLYLVPESIRHQFLRHAIAALEPGGLFVALTSGGGARWKRRLDRLQEGMATRFGVTRGAVVAPCDGEEIARLARTAGLESIAVADVGAGYLHGFELVTGHTPGGPA
jgi:SAM-dependent methyltransferase